MKAPPKGRAGTGKIIGRGNLSPGASKKQTGPAGVDRTIAIIPKNKREQLRVTVGTWQDRPVVSARVYYKADDGSWRPTRKGLAVSIEMLAQLIEALVQAELTAGRTPCG